MITANEARERVEQENNTKHYLTLLDTKIKLASDEGKDNIIMEWQEKINHKVFCEVAQTLVDNGYQVQTIPASHYYEYGAIKIAW